MSERAHDDPSHPAHDESPATAGAGGAADDDLLADLADEFAARARRGEHPTVEAYAARHPELADRIRKVFPAIAAIEGARSTEPPATAPGESPGATIGRYKLLERIGEGGFGVVYMAEQHHPVRRRVALKVVKPGMDSRQVLARFDAERQALAIMDHPNIAKVFDGGMTDTGRPYFVMELVKGEPITEFCDRNQLPPRQRLELFAQVCHAVQHAHQKGIIHRDIKPTNVLVAVHDTTPVVKVIDFGIAKALGQELTDRTLFTGFAQLVGTPLYMSPEQAGDSALDVDTRSDIYSLGVLLYELLTGTTPFDKERFRKAAQDEIRRIIREEEPPRPSTRLSESKDRLPSISAQRHTEPGKLARLVRGELDWIVMKALEKDRNRRYETANGLAADVRRYLADEAVLACPPSAAYRLRKLGRKYRVPVAVATGFLLLLLAGTIVSSYQALRIRAEQKNTLAQKREADKQRDDAKAQRAAADRHRDRAEQELARAAAAEQNALNEARKSDQVAKFLRDMLEGVGLSVAEGRDPAMLREILDRAAKRLEQLKDQPAVEADMCLVLGNVYLELHQPQSAEAVLSRGVSLRKRLPGRRDLMSRILIALGSSQANLQKYAESERAFTEALTIERERFGPNGWYVGYTLSCLGSMHRGKGDDARAEACFRDALRIYLGYRVTDLGSLRCITAALDQLATSLARQGKYAEAEPISRGSLELARAVAPPSGNTTLAHALLNLGMVLLHQGKAAEAVPHLREALDIQKRLGSPDTLGFEGKLAESLVLTNLKEAVLVVVEFLGPAAADAGAPTSSHDLFEERVKQLQQWAEWSERPARTDAKGHFHAACWRAVTASVLRGADRSPEGVSRADADADRAMEWLRKAVDAGFTDRARIKEWDHLEAVRDRDDYRQLVASLPADAHGVAAAAPADAPQPEAVKARPDPLNGGVNRLLGYVLTDQKNFEQAIAAYRRSLELDPGSCNGHSDLAWLLATCADARLRDPAEAIALAKTAVRIHPGAPGHLKTLGVAHYRAGDWKAAVAALEKSMQLDKGGNGSHWFFLAMAEWQSGNRDAARVWYEKAVGWMEQNLPKDAELVRFRAEAGELTGAVKPQELDAARQRLWERELAGLSKGVERHPGSPNALAARAQWLVAHGRFDAADRDYARLVELHPADHWHWYYRACLLAYLGREPDYREHCRAMWAQFAVTTDPAVLDRTTKAALLLPGGAGEDVRQLAGRAERVRQLAPDSPWTALLKGLAECRAGRYEQAAEWLEKSRTAMPGEWEPAARARAVAGDAYLALVRHRLGQTPEAGAALERAQRGARGTLPPADGKDPDPTMDVNLENLLIARIALREAEAVLGRRQPDTFSITNRSRTLTTSLPARPSAPSPFGGKAAAAVPGVVQAEDFDEGGQGLAYHDATHQNFNALGEAAATYRLESVDLEPSSDAGGGFHVAGVLTGEWLAYTVEVKQAGAYDLGLRVCSPGGGRLHVEFGGKDVTGPVEVPKTGWDKWTTVTVKKVPLGAARQVMRVVFDTPAGEDAWVCNLNWVEARRSP